MRSTRSCRGFLQQQEGSIAIAFSLALIPLVTFAGASLDYGRASQANAALQNHLDSIALGLVKRMGTMTPAQAAAAAKAALGSRVPQATIGDVTTSYDQTTGTLTLAAKADVATSFLGLISINKIGVAVSSTVAVLARDAACVIVLHPTQKHSFKTQGNGSVNVPNCGIHNNSNHRDAYDQGGSSWMKAKWMRGVGGYRGSNYAPLPEAGHPVLVDPLKDVPEPKAPTTCTHNNVKFTTPRTFPAETVYCGTITFEGDITFEAGIHYFVGAKVAMGSTNGMRGNEAMLYFDRTSSFSSASAGIVELTAPQSGTYQGIAVFGSRSASGQLFKFTGTKDYFVKGTIYLPAADLEMYGSADLNVSSKSGYVIASTFFYQGNSHFFFDAFGGAVPSGLGSSTDETRITK
jgi:Flp pilus assembly protein TadG